MDQKQLYTAPKVEALVVQTEGIVCGSSNGAKALIYSDIDNAAGASFSSGNIIEGGGF